MSSTILMSEIHTKYLEVYKSKLKDFDESFYETLKQGVMDALDESLSGRNITTTVFSIWSKDKDSSTVKYFIQELKGFGIQVSIMPSSHDSKQSQIEFKYNVNI